MDFDTRAALLLDPNLREHHRASARESLIPEFGEWDIDAKVDRFAAIGTKPFSILSYHNVFFHQVRQAYVLGASYPALVGACSLGERILNHLILDLRQFFVDTPAFKSVAKNQSFNDWDVQIRALKEWDVLLPDVLKSFKELKKLRHKSIHFNPDTYLSFDEDALSAITQMRTIVAQQFGTYYQAPWLIRGTIGHFFIKKEYETNPFVKTYFLPTLPSVGHLFGMALTENGWEIYDHANYGSGDWTDEEFAREYSERNPEMVIHSRP